MPARRTVGVIPTPAARPPHHDMCSIPALSSASTAAIPAVAGSPPPCPAACFKSPSVFHPAAAAAAAAAVSSAGRNGQRPRCAASPAAASTRSQRVSAVGAGPGSSKTSSQRRRRPVHDWRSITTTQKPAAGAQTHTHWAGRCTRTSTALEECSSHLPPPQQSHQAVRPQLAHRPGPDSSPTVQRSPASLHRSTVLELWSRREPLADLFVTHKSR